MSKLDISVNEIPRVLSAFYGSGRTPYFRSSPGIGKTDMVHAAADEIAALLQQNNHPHPEMAVYELHLASMSEVDVRGYLIPNGDEAIFTKPSFAKFVEQHPRGILFLDEFPQATHEVQKAVAPLLLNGRVGDYQLPREWMVVAAGNRAEDNSGANSMLAHVINRMSLINVIATNADDWIEWGAKVGIVAELLILAKVNPKVIFDTPNLEIADEPYPTPRSIHALSDVAKRWYGGLTGMVSDKAGMAVIEGFVGAGAASEIRATVTLTSKLPQYDDIVKNPDGIKLPTAPNEVYATVMMAAMRAEMQHRDQVMKYITRFQPNMAVVGLAALIQRDAQFTQAKGLAEWTKANRDMVQKLSRHIRVRRS